MKSDVEALPSLRCSSQERHFLHDGGVTFEFLDQYHSRSTARCDDCGCGGCGFLCEHQDWHWSCEIFIVRLERLCLASFFPSLINHPHIFKKSRSRATHHPDHSSSIGTSAFLFQHSIPAAIRHPQCSRMASISRVSLFSDKACTTLVKPTSVVDDLGRLS